MRAHWILVLALLCLVLPSGARAGRVFGDIRLGDKPLPAGVPVKIVRVTTEDGKPRTAAVPSDSTATDEFGSYKLMVKEPGKCVLAIVYEKQTASLEVFSYKEATRYDLILEKKDGKLALRRK
jgi:hypothetical protein